MTMEFPASSLSPSISPEVSRSPSPQAQIPQSWMTDFQRSSPTRKKNSRNQDSMQQLQAQLHNSMQAQLHASTPPLYPQKQLDSPNWAQSAQLVQRTRYSPPPPTRRHNSEDDLPITPGYEQEDACEQKYPEKTIYELDSKVSATTESGRDRVPTPRTLTFEDVPTPDGSFAVEDGERGDESFSAKKRENREIAWDQIQSEWKNFGGAVVLEIVIHILSAQNTPWISFQFTAADRYGAAEDGHGTKSADRFIDCAKDDLRISKTAACRLYLDLTKHWDKGPERKTGFYDAWEQCTYRQVHREKEEVIKQSSVGRQLSEVQRVNLLLQQECERLRKEKAEIQDQHARVRMNERDEQLCIICTVRKKTNAFLPCGHKCTCAECAEHLLVMGFTMLGTGTYGGKCPICRQHTNKHTKIYE